MVKFFDFGHCSDDKCSCVFQREFFFVPWKRESDACIAFTGRNGNLEYLIDL